MQIKCLKKTFQYITKRSGEPSQGSPELHINVLRVQVIYFEYIVVCTVVRSPYFIISASRNIAINFP